MIEMEKSQKHRVKPCLLSFFSNGGNELIDDSVCLQVLLGPGAAMGGTGSEPGVPSLPPMAR